MDMKHFRNDGKLKLLIIVGTRPEIIRLVCRRIPGFRESAGLHVPRRAFFLEDRRILRTVPALFRGSFRIHARHGLAWSGPRRVPAALLRALGRRCYGPFDVRKMAPRLCG